MESNRALEHAGSSGFAIYAALHKLRFFAPAEHRASFFCSEAQISRMCGLTPRRLREHLLALETAGLVKIQRPMGAEKIMHQASRISLLPVFEAGNKITPSPDETSGADRTKRPHRRGREAYTKTSVIAESLLPEGGGGTRLPVPAAAPCAGAAGTDAASESSTVITSTPSIHDEW